MRALEFVVVLVLLGAVVWAISAPLRRERDDADQPSPGRVPELEAAKENKYREIRDAELDYRTGKLSEADYRALERTLRAEAVAILRELDRERDRYDA